MTRRIKYYSELLPNLKTEIRKGVENGHLSWTKINHRNQDYKAVVFDSSNESWLVLIDIYMAEFVNH